MQSTTAFASTPWEAFRLTSKPPSELIQTLGPHGVDDLIRHMLAACWREAPAETRTYKAVLQTAREVFDRNVKVWSAMSKPSPENFFADLRPFPADGFARQALVLCWMMLPRGKRSAADVAKVVSHIFQRNLSAWDEDHEVLTKGPQRLGKGKPVSIKPVKAKGKKVVKKAGKGKR